MQPISTAEAEALFADLKGAPALVLAVSGGPDSTALLVLAARWRARLKRGPKLIAVTIDHRLRVESASEAKAVKRLAQTLGVAHHTLRWSGRKPSTGLPAAARAARYRLLADAAHKAGARHILTAHTLDDQAETVLIRLARGSGLTGLAGMARVSTPSPRWGEGRAAGAQRSNGRSVADGEMLLVRPFLAIPKARLIATLAAAGVTYADDPSNRDPRYTRARLRRLAPTLAAEGLDARRLALLAQRAARADAAIEASVEEARARLSATQWPYAGPIVLDARGFAKLPAEVALRLLARAIAQVGDEGPVELAKLEALFAALDGSPDRFRRTLAGALVTRAGGRLTVERAPSRRGQAGLTSRAAKRTGQA